MIFWKSGVEDGDLRVWLGLCEDVDDGTVRWITSARLSLRAALWRAADGWAGH